MLNHPQIDPVALQIGPLAIHWYGLTYLAAFGLFLYLGFRRLRHPPFATLAGSSAWTRQDVEDMLFLGVLGVVAGGRRIDWDYQGSLDAALSQIERAFGKDLRYTLVRLRRNDRSADLPPPHPLAYRHSRRAHRR